MRRKTIAKWLGLLLLFLLGWLLWWLFGGILTRPPRTATIQTLFNGVTYERRALDLPRPIMVHIVEIDLRAEGIGFVSTTPVKTADGEMLARRTTDFLQQSGAQLAINGSFFYPFFFHSIFDYAPHEGDPVYVVGLGIFNGAIYSEDSVGRPVVCFTGAQIAIRPIDCPPNTEQALAGDIILLEHGEPQLDDAENAYHTEPEPRTVIALDAAAQTAWFILVDGRQSGYSEGMTMEEVANLLIELGAEIAINLDGGGSTTLAYAEAGKPRLLNSPIHARLPMWERPIANHIGLLAGPYR